MVTVETVLVLGVGASCDFGFPTGKKLVTQIYTLFTASESKLPNLFFEIAGQENPEMAENFPHILQQANPLFISLELQPPQDYKASPLRLSTISVLSG